MQTILHRLEKFLLRGPVETAKLLGVSYSNYAAMKATDRPIKKYIRFHAETILKLKGDQLQEIIKDRLA